MKLKLDENFDVRLVPFITEMGHEADTVFSENLSGSEDETIYDVCRKERRILVTLDLDFSNPMRFPPEFTEGIVVLRPSQLILSVIRTMLASVLPSFSTETLKGRLWIVEPGRIRIYDPQE